MKTDYAGQANKGGIYRITNLKNRKIYIGSAKHFKQRCYGHFSSLRNNKHSNKHLQASFNKYGEDAFLFEVIEAVADNDKKSRFVVEQYYIDSIRQEFARWNWSYNFKKETIQKERTIFSKNPEETKRKCAEASKRSWTDPELRAKRMKTFQSREFREGQSKRQKEASRNPEYGNSAEAHKKRYSNPENREKLSKKLKEAWARDDGTRKQKASKVGKECYEQNKDKITAAREKAKAKDYGKVISPEGNIYHVYNAHKFMKEHNLNNPFYELLNGKYSTYKGWKLAE